MNELREFGAIAKLIKGKRLGHPKRYSQSELSHILGYKNGQFISNVERALCNIPLKMLIRVSQVLDIDPADLKEAIMKDHGNTLDNYLPKPKMDNRLGYPFSYQKREQFCENGMVQAV